MTEVMVHVYEQPLPAFANLRPLSSLTGSEIALGLAEIKRHGMAEDRLRRLHRATDGDWCVAVRTLSRPDHREGGRLTQGWQFMSLELGAQAFADPAGAEALLERREREAAEEAKRGAAAHAERQRVRLQELRAEEELKKRFDEESWIELPPISQGLFVLALAHQDAGQPELAESYRSLAWLWANRRYAGGQLAPLPLPRREWKQAEPAAEPPPGGGDEAVPADAPTSATPADESTAPTEGGTTP